MSSSAYEKSWLSSMLAGRFFGSCDAHQGKESKYFCVSCREVCCERCLHGHQAHLIIQIRRYMYKNVVEVRDVSQLVDVTGIQPYMCNHEKSIHLNKLSPSRPPLPNATNICLDCGRQLKPGFTFCSLECKQAHHHATHKRELHGAPVPHAKRQHVVQQEAGTPRKAAHAGDDTRSDYSSESESCAIPLDDVVTPTAITSNSLTRRKQRWPKRSPWA